MKTIINQMKRNCELENVPVERRHQFTFDLIRVIIKMKLLVKNNNKKLEAKT